MKKSPYTILAGNGRSGSNLLLSILDASPLTFCRNEPQEIKGSPINNLPYPSGKEYETVMSVRWDEFVSWTHLRMGERDLRLGAPKEFLRDYIRQLYLYRLLGRRRILQYFRLVFPKMDSEEWLPPTWLVDAQKLANSQLIIKPNDIHAYHIQWVLEHRQNVKVLHIVRHPGGQLNSGYKRFFSQLSESQLEDETLKYRNMLRDLILAYPHWDKNLKDVDELNLYEAVVWFWLINNEEIYANNKENPNYKLVLFEDLLFNRMKIATEIYNFCDLNLSADVRARIDAQAENSPWGKVRAAPDVIVHDWNNSVLSREIDLAQNLMKDTQIGQYWAKND